jgi:hypothetical protein
MIRAAGCQKISSRGIERRPDYIQAMSVGQERSDHEAGK